MKKYKAKIISLVLGCALIISSTATVFGAGNVTYKGQAEKFIFEPGSEYSVTDLFTDFKGVMPGDSITQTVTVRNESAENSRVEIFMRALGSTDLKNPEDGIADVSKAESDDFLKEMNLTVKAQSGKNLFKATANKKDGLSKWVSLGIFEPGAEVDLAVTLNVPITMGNDYQERIGALDWQFKVVDPPQEAGDSSKTGDESNILVWAIAAIAAALGGVIVIAMRRRREN